jgi:hypothetical protein
MSKLGCLIALTVLAAIPAAAQTAIPDVRGTWKGESESLVLGGGNPHHTGTQANEPQLRSVPFTLTVDKQDGRRFSGTFSSPRSTEKVIAVISRNGTIFLADDEGYTHGILLAPDGALLSPRLIRLAHCIVRGAHQAVRRGMRQRGGFTIC